MKSPASHNATAEEARQFFLQRIQQQASAEGQPLSPLLLLLFVVAGGLALADSHPPPLRPAPVIMRQDDEHSYPPHSNTGRTGIQSSDVAKRHGGQFMMLKFALRFAVTFVLMVTGATISTAGDHTARSNQSALLPAVQCCDVCPPICPLRHNRK